MKISLASEFSQNLLRDFFILSEELEQELSAKGRGQSLVPGVVGYELS